MGFRNGFSGESSGLEEITGGKLARWWPRVEGRMARQLDAHGRDEKSTDASS